MTLAPIILFVYNRPWHTEKTLTALMANDLADESLLYIHADGPKFGSLKEGLEKVQAVRSVIRRRQWCKEVKIIELEYNRVLDRSNWSNLGLKLPLFFNYQAIQITPLIPFFKYS